MTSGLLFRKHSHFWVIFGTSILNNSYKRLKCFEQIISIAAIENIYFTIKINKNLRFYYNLQRFGPFYCFRFQLMPGLGGYM